MNNHRNLFFLFRSFFCIVFYFFFWSNFGLASGEYFTTIILINQEAELVDLTEDGIILKRHRKIPDYFSTSRSHESMILLNASGKEIGHHQGDHFLPGSSDLPKACLQNSMTIDTRNKKEKILQDLFLVSKAEGSHLIPQIDHTSKDNITFGNIHPSYNEYSIRKPPLPFHSLFAERQQNQTLRRFDRDDIINSKRPLRQEEV